MQGVLERVREFATRFEARFGPSVETILLYGSVARGEYRPGLSDLNLLMILQRLELPELRRAAPLLGSWLEEGNPPPLLVSRTEWEGSADVFPLEYSEIRDAHLLLAGRNPFEGMRIYREHLRLQLEHELRAKMIQLREGFLVAGEDPEGVGSLLLRSFPVFLTLLRGILRLEGVAVPRTTAEILASIAQRAQLSVDPFLRILHAREEGGTLSVSIDDPLCGDYLAAIQGAALWLDAAAERVHAGELV